MMKIAIAGTNGLAQFIGYYLSQATPHNFVFLTRTANPGLKERDWQVLVVDYEDPASLAYTLKGIDVVISTICDSAQYALVEAAAAAQVHHFIPSGFSGPEQSAPRSIGQGYWQGLIALLQHHAATSSMRYTLFTCGVLYERFGPGGTNTLQISTLNNRHSAVGEEGNLLIDMRLGKATIPVTPSHEQLAVCMTSARDVARYVVAALQTYEDMTVWPEEFRFCTQRLTMSELVTICTRVRANTKSLSPGTPIVPTFTTREALLHNHASAIQANNTNQALSLAQHIAIAEAHPALNFPVTSINLPASILPYVYGSGPEPTTSELFEVWLARAWSTPQPTPAPSSANTSGKQSGKSSRSGSGQLSKEATPLGENPRKLS
ncbi:hypothetical protein PMZ80_005514 [Knufia obscura]|uniref:NmrA-like domain-containing protein n=1 Tax=Knufia obscura TaxID=1635080 RepID=A0ABR0RLS0_9EURO|nr:hypothetical protein PMZ80_005514 [Knufia obscura]